jgi:hypothetical protein
VWVLRDVGPLDTECAEKNVRGPHHCTAPLSVNGPVASQTLIHVREWRRCAFNAATCSASWAGMRSHRASGRYGSARCASRDPVRERTTRQQRPGHVRALRVVAGGAATGPARPGTAHHGTHPSPVEISSGSLTNLVNKTDYVKRGRRPLMPAPGPGWLGANGDRGRTARRG